MAVDDTAVEHGRRALAEAPSLTGSHRAPGSAALLVAALADLSPRHRSVLWLGVVEGRSPEEIGADLGISGAAASALLRRAREALRTARDAAGDGGLAATG
jgi:RNA polymerase sigma factor (sigma-70 family)